MRKSALVTKRIFVYEFDPFIFVIVDFCGREQVKGYPTFRMYVNGIQHDYSGERTASDFITAFRKTIDSAKVEL